MTIIEKKSERKKKAIMKLVESGEYSIAYALMLAEELNDSGKLLDNNYEELAEYLEGLLEEEKEVETVEVAEETEPVEEVTEDIPEESEE